MDRENAIMSVGDGLKTKIHIHNADQIGGCVTVISTDSTRIIIDYGEVLPGSDEQNGYQYDWSEGVNGVFFTHYHGDHIGRFKEIPESVPIYMGNLTRKVMTTISKYIKDTEALNILKDDKRVHEIVADETIEVGDIKVTPYMIDHSAYDAYMFLIETDDKRILHTGDFRGHGYRGKAILPLIKKYICNNEKREIDVLIIEGTMMTRTSEKFYSEMDMYRDADELFREYKYVFLICSSTNLDSLATFYQAAKKQHIKTYGNAYICEQLKNFHNTAGTYSDLYKFDYVYPVNFDKKICGELSQEEFMRQEGFLIIIKPEETYLKWIQRFEDLTPVVVYSMWNGYLDSDHKAYKKEWKQFMDTCSCKKYMHTSGHATKELIESVIKEVNPKMAILPMHTEGIEEFKRLNISAELKNIIKEQGVFE